MCLDRVPDVLSKVRSATVTVLMSISNTGHAVVTTASCSTVSTRGSRNAIFLMHWRRGEEEEGGRRSGIGRRTREKDDRKKTEKGIGMSTVFTVYRHVQVLEVSGLSVKGVKNAVYASVCFMLLHCM